YTNIFFFFSSRRRHTRSKRDWSSDVCSSDLEIQKVMSEINSLAPGVGQILAIHGDSGTGKSSLARSILRNLRGWSAYSMTATPEMGTAEVIDRVNLVLTESESENAQGELDSLVSDVDARPAVAPDFDDPLEQMVHLVD